MAKRTTKYAVETKGLKKSFGKLKVLDGIGLQIERGTILALLGPNGAGKTTTIRILSTLLLPDEGTASINGYDVASQPDEVRASIGLTGQFAAVDEYLTGEENLLMIGRLYRLSPSDVSRRAKELLEQFDLVDASKRPVRTYSGGMRRRLDLAMSLIALPPIIFLDEPTTGLDPRSRLAMWDMIKQLAAHKITILLTTQYMDEADYLADRIVVIDNGKVIAEGTANDLKAKVGADRLEFGISEKSNLEKAMKLIGGDAQKSNSENRTISIASKGGARQAKELLQKLEDANITVETFSLHRPALDDVFLSLTGHAATDAENQPQKGKK